VNLKVRSLGTLLLVVSIGFGVAAAPLYNPAGVVWASDDWPKWNSVTPAGVGILDVSLDATGAVAETSVLRELPSITDQLKSTVKTWKFSPATDGTASPPSQVLVVFFIAPPAGVTLAPPVSPLLPEDGLAGYVPPGITSLSYPQYPESFFVDLTERWAIGKRFALSSPLRVSR
jgi:hypothetical protein